MCIIAIKPSGIKITRKTLENCYENNPDGAGFMYPHQGRVEYQKGFMTFGTFWAAWAKTRDNLSLNKQLVVFHFRIATAGSIIPGQCHPFPVTKDVDKMQELKGKCLMAIAHNGILPGWGMREISDTMEFVRDILALPAVQKTISYPKVQELLTKHINGSKIAILQATGDMITLGKGWVEDKGVRFSNDGYKKISWYQSPELRGWEYKWGMDFNYNVLERAEGDRK